MGQLYYYNNPWSRVGFHFRGAFFDLVSLNSYVRVLDIISQQHLFDFSYFKDCKVGLGIL